MAYELWETRSGNLMEWFDTEAEALAAVADAIARHGESYVASLVLLHEDDRGEIRAVATADVLAERARIGTASSS